MIIYPFSSAVILTDDIFTLYGGQTGTTVPAQRNAAYLIAEKRASNYIGTLLLPHIVTGTYPANSDKFITTDYGYVHRVISAKVLSVSNLQTCELSSDTGCVFVAEDTFGYLNFSCINSICGCAGWKVPYQYQVVYEAGLPTGTASQADVLLALTIVAQDTLNEMSFPSANETAGDRGIESFSSLDYSETRKKLKRTALGQSARANYASELLDNAVKRAVPYIGI